MLAGIIADRQPRQKIIDNMTPQDFAKAFYDEKENLLDIYFERKPNPIADVAPPSDVAELIKRLNLDKIQKDMLFQILDGALRDTMYTILLALDGSSSLGTEEQQMFGLTDENGNKLTEGHLEGHAWEYFHGQKN